MSNTVDTSRHFTIPTELFPCQRHAITFHKPTYADYVRAHKLYPAAQSDAGVGFSFNDFLAALCIRTPDGQEIESNPQDAIERWDNVELRDHLFALNYFVSAVLMDQPLQDEAETLADNLFHLFPNELAFSIDKEQLPAASSTLTFNRPQNSVMVSVQKSYTSEKVNGCSLSQMLFLTCLTQIEGEALNLNDSNVILKGYDLEIVDVEFASAVFMKLNVPNETELNKAVSLGKKLRRLNLPTVTAPEKVKSGSDLTVITPVV